MANIICLLSPCVRASERVRRSALRKNSPIAQEHLSLSSIDQLRNLPASQ